MMLLQYGASELERCCQYLGLINPGEYLEDMHIEVRYEIGYGESDLAKRFIDLLENT